MIALKALIIFGWYSGFAGVVLRWRHFAALLALDLAEAFLVWVPSQTARAFGAWAVNFARTVRTR